MQAEAPSHDSVFGANHSSSKAFSLSDDEIAESSSLYYYLKSGTYYLTEDLVLSKPMDLLPSYFGSDSLTVNICLNGHKISATDKFFEVYNSSRLNIHDCSADCSGTLFGGKGLYVMGGTLDLCGGSITDSSGGYGIGGGVTVCGGGTFNMYDGVITNCKASGGGGGGVSVSGATFNMYGGTISNNTTNNSDGGAGVLVSGGAFKMYGGSIINNWVDANKASADQDFSMWYYGAGVSVHNEETFFLQGDVNITGNYRVKGNSKVINNVELFRSHKPDGSKKDGYYGGAVCAPNIKLTGKLGENAKIGITVQNGVFTDNYTAAGNTEDPSKYFILDGGATGSLKIGYDGTGKEAAVVDSSEQLTYMLESARVIGAAGATVGDTKIKLTIEATLAAGTKKQTITEVKDVTLAQPLSGGINRGTYDYTYEGVTKNIPYEIEAAKYKTFVIWSCNGTQRGQNEYSRVYDGTDVSGSVRARYTGYDGEEVRVEGMTDRVILQNANGENVTSTAKPDTYYFHLVDSDDYVFDNNTLTLEVVPTDDIIYEMKDAEVVGVVGSPSIGDSTIKVRIKLTLVDTDDSAIETTKIVEHTVTPDTALTVGRKTINFTYTYGEKSKDLSVTVDVSKKSVNVEWYHNNQLVGSNSLNHVFDDKDEITKIVAKYDGIDGRKQTVRASSNSVIIKDANGNTVNSLKNIGVYTLTLAADENYVFGNNLFTYTVVEKLSDIAQLIYEESGVTVLGVSYSDGSTFDNGTELKAEKTTVGNTSVVSGEIHTAYNVNIVKGTANVTLKGKVTANIMIPNDLRDKTYKIYNLNGNVATELPYTANGNYATFESRSLTCILLVVVSDEPPVDPIDPDDPDDPDNPDNPDDPDNPDNPDDPDDPNDPSHGNNGDNPFISANIDGAGLTWLWVLLVIVGAVAIIAIVALVCKSKSKKK